jgi:hypothetical protein
VQLCHQTAWMSTSVSDVSQTVAGCELDWVRCRLGMCSGGTYVSIRDLSAEKREI